MRCTVPAAALAVVLMTTPALANIACYVDISAGKTITSTRVSDDFSGPYVIAASGAQIGAGGGCDVTVPGLMHGLVIGALGRYDMQDVDTRFESGSISSDAAWTAAMRVGVKVNPGTLLYGLGGMSWTDIAYPGAMEINARGYVYGAGIEIDIGVPNLSVYAEWSHTQWGRASDFDMTLRPDSDTIRIGVKLKLGTADMPKILP